VRGREESILEEEAGVEGKKKCDSSMRQCSYSLVERWRRRGRVYV